MPLPPHLAQMGMRYPIEVLASGAGKRLIYKDFWNIGLKKNMPQHYKDYHNLWRTGPQEHIHSRPTQARFEKDEWGEIYPVQNPRIYVIYPDKFHQGLWGGEGVIKGLLKREDGNHRNFKPPPAKYWWPTLFELVLHSEILDKNIEMIGTKRGVRLVDEAGGFDSYLLNTPVNEIYATGLLRLKRELLLSLVDRDKYVNSGGKGLVWDKYQNWAVGAEEADWHGLTLDEAKSKQAAIEREALERETIPDKLKFRQELLEMLRSGKLDELDLELADEQNSEGNSGFKGMLGGISKVFKK